VIDLGVGLSLYGAIRSVPIRDGVMPIAEVGLAGDLRPVFNLHRRVELGARMGFREFIISDKARDDLSDLKGVSVHHKRYLKDAISTCFQGPSRTAMVPDDGCQSAQRESIRNCRGCWKQHTVRT